VTPESDPASGATHTRPSASVIGAFGALGVPVSLDGGQGASWRVGDRILKPLDLAMEELSWQADVLSTIACDGFRVARPIRSRDGSLVVDGWCAWEWTRGRHEPRRWAEIVLAGERFHCALASIPRPGFISVRTDPWAIGDRVAWGEIPAAEFRQVKHLPRLVDALRPISAPSQLIHGDLTGNVLFANGSPPAIIDFSPYWRPPGFASAIVVGDALIWEGAGQGLLDQLCDIPDLGQFLLRGLIYRVVTDRVSRPNERIRPDDADPYRQAVDLACRFAAGR
jgi:uncharacterized protein (TIGR02569 family)